MNTTLLFVEIFIAGVQGLIWVVLLTLTLTGYQWVINLKFQEIGNWSFLISALIFSFAYSLGIIIDRTVNTLYHRWDKKIGSQYFPAQAKSLSVVRFQLENEYLNKQLEYVRTRLRIARASSLNYLLITIFSITLISSLDFLTWVQKWRYCIVTAVIGALLILMFVASWASLTRTNYYMVAQNLPETNQDKSTQGTKMLDSETSM